MLFDLKKLSVEIEKHDELKTLVRADESTIVRFKKSEYPIFTYTLGSRDCCAGIVNHRRGPRH